MRTIARRRQYRQIGSLSALDDQRDIRWIVETSGIDVRGVQRKIGDTATGDQCRQTRRGLALFNIDTPQLATHIAKVELIDIAVTVDIDGLDTPGNTVLHIDQLQVGAGVGPGAPQQVTGIGIDDVDTAADRIRCPHTDRVLPGIVAATEDQHGLRGPAQLQPFNIWRRPGLAQFGEVSRATFDNPAQFRAVAIAHVQREDVAATTALTEIKIDVITTIIEIAVLVGIVYPGHDATIEAVTSARHRYVLEQVVQPGQHLLRHESEVFLTADRVHCVQIAFVGRDVSHQVGITIGQLTVLHQCRLRVQRITHDALGLHRFIITVLIQHIVAVGPGQ